MYNTISRPVEILLVEDNPGDVYLTQKAFKKAKISNNLQVAEDGEIALARMRNEEGHESAAKPDIVFLDINLPKIDGTQVLAAMKTDEALRRIPVIILSSSSAESDIVKSYDLHASAYIVKPLSLENFDKVVTAIEQFWFGVVVLPPGNN